LANAPRCMSTPLIQEFSLRGRLCSRVIANFREYRWPDAISMRRDFRGGASGLMRKAANKNGGEVTPPS
jgi:hypothetical protein